LALSFGSSFISSLSSINTQTGLSIVQPVLTYYYGWSFSPWNCCPAGKIFSTKDSLFAQNNHLMMSLSGQSQEGTGLGGFGPGDTIFGSIVNTGGSVPRLPSFDLLFK